MRSVLTCGCLLTLVSVILASKEIDLKEDGDVVEVPVTVAEWSPRSLVNFEEIGGDFEGDIELPLPIIPRNGLIDKRYHWPNGQVPYVISDLFSPSESKQIEGAMAQVTNVTDNCITFHKRTTEEDYIFFQKNEKKGCQSSVGKRGGKQIVNYHPLCLKVFGTVMHEMLHFLGFYHEQSRFDRDDSIDILWDNISLDRYHNFKPYSRSTITGFGEGYDYDSIMHYSAYAFSKDGKKTIQTKDPKAKIGQRVKLSKTDIAKLKKMYEC